MGCELSSNLYFGANKRDTVRLQFVIGEGIENYMNDAPVDVVAKANPSDPVRPVRGEPLPITGVVAFLDHKWNEQWSSTGGYSRIDVDNQNGRAAERISGRRIRPRQPALLPSPECDGGAEFQWGRRENFADGFRSDGAKLQFSFRYNFSHKIGS
jgi:hypothetical protein